MQVEGARLLEVQVVEAEAVTQEGLVVMGRAQVPDLLVQAPTA